MEERVKRIMEALSKKTVANGCTPGEEAAARAKLAELQAKYHVEAPPDPRDALDLLRKVREAARAAAAKAAAAQASKEPPKAQPRPKESPRASGFESIRECAEYWIRAGLKNQDVADAVRRAFPDAETSAASVAWYRSQMRKRGAL